MSRGQEGKEFAVLFHPCILGFESCDRAQTGLMQLLLQGSMGFPRCLDSHSPVFDRVRREYMEILRTFHEDGYFQREDEQTVTERFLLTAVYTGRSSGDTGRTCGFCPACQDRKGI